MRLTHFGPLLAGLLLAAACATIDSTPEAPSITETDRTQAARVHPQLLQQLGGAVVGPRAAYAASVGERVAGAASVPGQCTFTLGNSDVPNAFAIPGCYIYVTRGLLTLMNPEDELASVLGHEVGHVVADHAARRQNTAALTGLGAVRAGDTAQSLSSRMAFDTFRLERFLVLNGREAGDILRAGERVKIVTHARQVCHAVAGRLTAIKRISPGVC